MSCQNLEVDRRNPVLPKNVTCKNKNTKNFKEIKILKSWPTHDQTYHTYHACISQIVVYFRLFCGRSIKLVDLIRQIVGITDNLGSDLNKTNVSIHD